MMRLHGMLKNNEYPNCPKLAKEMEISVRTLKRDVDFMKCRLNLPIEYDAQKYGYYYSKPVNQFPNLQLTEAELFALLVAHKAIAQYHGTEVQKPLESAFRKLTGQLDQSTLYTLGNLDGALSFRPFAPADADLATFESLTTALKESRAVTFVYKKLGAKKAQRRHVHPYHLACIDNHWYLFAFDVDRQAIRTFSLTRLSRLDVTRQKFTRRQDFNADEYLRGSFQVFKGGGNYEVVIVFDDWATDLLRGRKWHASQEMTDLPNGESRLRLRLNNLEEVESWIMSWGIHATVIAPTELRERILNTLEAMLPHYGGSMVMH
jgi:proteasome accessory factor B